MAKTENIRLVDTHAHIDGEDYGADREEMLARAKEAGVVAVVTFGDTMEASARAVKLAAEHETVFAGVGVHPENIFPFTQEDDERLAAWTKEKNVVAIGEIGLDYYWERTRRSERFSGKCSRVSLRWHAISICPSASMIGKPTAT